MMEKWDERDGGSEKWDGKVSRTCCIGGVAFVFVGGCFFGEGDLVESLKDMLCSGFCFGGCRTPPSLSSQARGFGWSVVVLGGLFDWYWWFLVNG